jgi:hypothetical protein
MRFLKVKTIFINPMEKKMQINKYFNIKRFGLLLRKDFYTHYKTYLIALGAIFSILFIINISSIVSYHSWNFNSVFYPLTLFISGFIFTSISFRDLDRDESRISFLTLPASVLEKFMSKLLITSIGYVIVSLALFFIFSVAAFLISHLIFGYSHPVFNPLSKDIGHCIILYMIMQSAFLSGAVYFRGNAFFKTIVSAFVICIIYVIFVALVLYVIYIIMSHKGHMFVASDKLSIELLLNLRNSSDSIIKSIVTIFTRTIDIFFRYAFAPLMWVIACFRLKETEV